MASVLIIEVYHGYPTSLDNAASRLRGCRQRHAFRSIAMPGTSWTVSSIDMAITV